MRLAILHPIPSPYRENLFTEMSGLNGLDLTVYYCARNVTGYRDWRFRSRGYRQEILPGKELRNGLLVNPVILRRLWEQRPDLLAVWGWSDPTAVLSLLAARMLKIPSVLFSASALPLYLPKTGPVGAVAVTKMKQFLVKLPRAFLTPGKLARDYLVSLGVSSGRIHVLPINCLDTSYWQGLATMTGPEQEEHKRRFGFAGKRVILYLGRVMSGKGIPTLFDAYADLRRRHGDLALLVVGGGPQLDDFREDAFRRGLPEVHFAGPQPYEALPQFYGISDCLVLPTLSDQWPLVVLEALTCGLPVVTTSRCGAAPDLLEGRGTGVVVAPGDAGALARGLEEILALPPREKEAMRQRALATAAAYDYRLAARKLAKVLDFEYRRAFAD